MTFLDFMSKEKKNSLFWTKLRYNSVGAFRMVLNQKYEKIMDLRKLW